MLWFENHTNRYPWQVSASEGGTMDLIGGGKASPHFKAISNMGLIPRVLVCPSDIFKTAAMNFASLMDSNVSYFVNLDVSLKRPATAIAAGDRHLRANGVPVKPGPLTLTTNVNIGWTRELHNIASTPSGVLVFADSHAEVVRRDLNHAFGAQGEATNRLVVP
jgi:hypothetical protein